MTLASLPQADRDALVRWQAQAIKDCAWQQALPSLAAEFPADDGAPFVGQPRVDLRALHAVTGGGPLVQGANGALVLLDAPARDLGFEHAVRSTRHTVNGTTRVLDVRADRDHDVCVISLDGEEIFRTELAPSVPVIASYDGQVSGVASGDLSPLVAGRGAEPAAAIDSRPLLAPVLAALVPTVRAERALAQLLGASEDAARQAFPLQPSRAPDVVRLRAVTATPFAPGARMFGATASLAPIYDGGTVQLELLYDGLDADLIAIRAGVAVAAGGKAVQLAAITAGDRVAHDDAASRACFTARAVASQFELAQPRSPAFDEQLAGCAHLAVDGYAALAGGADTRLAIATMAIGPGVAPTAYRGWDHALITIAQRMDAQGVALRELDPGQTIAELGSVVARHAALREATVDPEVRGALVALVFHWWFAALEPTPALITSLGSALRNTASYPDAVQQMLADLGDGVGELDAGPRAVACGVELVDARRAEIDHALASVAKVPFADGFHRDLLGQILQLCPTSAALAQLETSTVAVTAFVTADQARAGGSTLFALDIEPLVDHALGQTWSTATFAAFSDLVDFALVGDATFCASNASRAEQAACIDSSLARFSAAEPDGVLAPSVAARYATMARALIARWPSLADARFIDTRFDLTEAWSAGLWRACSDAGFDRAQKQLFTLLDALRAATSFDDRFALETQIADLLHQATCS